jgi:hypothetical protein
MKWNWQQEDWPNFQRDITDEYYQYGTPQNLNFSIAHRIK